MLIRSLIAFARSKDLLSDPGFDRRRLHWLIELDASGTYKRLTPLTTTVERNGRTREVSGRDMLLPSRYPLRVGEPGTILNVGNAGGEAQFLADDVRAVLGMEPKDDTLNEDNGPRMTTLKKARNFRGLLEACRNEIGECLVVEAILKFFGSDTELERARRDVLEGLSIATAGDPEDLHAHRGRRRIKAGDRFSFQIGDDLAIDEPAILDWWRRAFAATREHVLKASPRGRCMVTGHHGAILMLHPALSKPLPGGNTFGAKLASFDKEAYKSFGLEASLNSPTSADTAEAYVRALDSLLEDPDHHLRVGSATACFWSDGAELPVGLLDEPDPAAVRAFLQSPFATRPHSLPGRDQFRAMILSGYTARIVVRSWLEMTIEEATCHLQAWFRDIALAKRDGRDRFAGVRAIAGSMVRELEELPPRLVPQLFAVALAGSQVPAQFLAAAIGRQRLDRARTPKKGLESWQREERQADRAALIRLCLNRQGGTFMSTAIDPTSENPAYLCGQLLQILDSIHYHAHGGQSASSPADRYYGSASATPGLVFPRLCRLARHQLDKIDRPGLRISLDRDLGAVVARLDLVSGGVFPRTLSLTDQGRFALGFYHERTARLAAPDRPTPEPQESPREETKA